MTEVSYLMLYEGRGWSWDLNPSLFDSRAWFLTTRHPPLLRMAPTEPAFLSNVILALLKLPWLI